MTNEEYIKMHREADVRRLALARVPEGVDHKWCLQQIEGWQMARKKLPRWAATDGLWYPVRLSMEQCSGEQTALYKRSVVERLIPEAQRRAMADLTGGLGVDFSHLAPLFDEATYVEILPELRRLAEHNIPLLMEKMRDGENEKMRRTALRLAAPDDFSLFPVEPSVGPQSSDDAFPFSFVFLDPARRDVAGRKTVGIGDCTPNVLDMQDELLLRAQCVMVKLSPMLDITEALRQLKNVREVHVVSVQGECKELLFVMQTSPCADPDPSENGRELSCEENGITIHCVNLGVDEDVVKTFLNPPMGWGGSMGEPKRWGDKILPFKGELEGVLYEPNASILKADVQDILCECYDVRKLHPMSNLFVGDTLIPHFPGRRFRITGVSDFSKRGVKSLIGDLAKANLTTRNFPVSVAQLRRQLHLSEGGDAYLFATTVGDGRHVLIRCRRITENSDEP